MKKRDHSHKNFGPWNSMLLLLGIRLGLIIFNYFFWFFILSDSF